MKATYVEWLLRNDIFGYGTKISASTSGAGK